MKAITVRQPWATLLAIEAKAVETRSWKTEYRGPVLIHAGASRKGAELELEQIEPFLSALDQHADEAQVRIETPLPRGHKFFTEPDMDVYACACGAELTALKYALRDSRARIEAGCTEPGNAPAGAPYPHQPSAVTLPVLTTAGVRALVEARER